MKSSMVLKSPHQNEIKGSHEFEFTVLNINTKRELREKITLNLP